jgi:hypothetical protein
MNTISSQDTRLYGLVLEEGDDFRQVHEAILTCEGQGYDEQVSLPSVIRQWPDVLQHAVLADLSNSDHYQLFLNLGAWTHRSYRNPLHLEKVMQHPDGTIEIVLNPVFSDPVVLKYVPYWGPDEPEWDLLSPDRNIMPDWFASKVAEAEKEGVNMGVFLKDDFHVPDSESLPDRGVGTAESAVLDAMEATKAKAEVPDSMKRIAFEGGQVKFDCITTAPDIELPLSEATFILQDSGLYWVEMVIEGQGGDPRGYQNLIKAIAHKHTTGSFMIRTSDQQAPIVGVFDQSTYEINPLENGMSLEGTAQVSFVD